MARFGLLGRLLLIFLSAMLALAAVSLLLLRWQETHPAPARSGGFQRIRQVAADADLLDASAPASWPAELRALGGQPLHLRLQPSEPDVEGFIRAPRLEARLHGFAETPTGRATRAYTDTEQSRRDPRDGVEGFLARAVVPLPDGRFLVADPVIEARRDGGPTLVGLPTGLWIGLCGALLSALAVWGAARETKPLRALIRSLDAFDGSTADAAPVRASAADMRALATAVNAMQARVAGLMRERTLMLGAVSHDLRTLLTRLQLRVLGVPDEPARLRFSADLEAMRALIDDALAFARGTDVAVARRRQDLADLVASEVAEREALGSPPPIACDLQDGPVLGDASALRRVVANLLDNAVRFGRARIDVRVRDTGDAVELTVGDDGPGVPEDQRAAVLLPYHRVEESRSRATGGVGLGLAIAHRIVEAHGGALSIGTSALGGAEVRVSLPRAPERPRSG